MLKRNNIGSLYGLLNTVIYITFPVKCPEVALAMLSDDKYVATGIGLTMPAPYLDYIADIRCMITTSCYD